LLLRGRIERTLHAGAFTRRGLVGEIRLARAGCRSEGFALESRQLVFFGA
jgi:hypothetical protein